MPFDDARLDRLKDVSPTLADARNKRDLIKNLTEKINALVAEREGLKRDLTGLRRQVQNEFERV